MTARRLFFFCRPVFMRPIKTTTEFSTADQLLCGLQSESVPCPLNSEKRRKKTGVIGITTMLELA